MKSSSPSVRFCLCLLLFHAHLSLAKRGGGGFGKSFGLGKTSSKGSSTSNRGNTNTNKGRNPNQGTNNQPGNYPRQNQNPQAGYPNQQPGQAGYPNQQPGQAGYPNQQPGRAGYPNQYPAGGYPAGGYPAGGYPARGYPSGGSYPGAYGGGYGYGGGYMNHNPNNRILSPQYGGSYGYGGYGGAGGSPFSRSVQNMGMGPSSNSRGFGRNAMMAAGAGAVAGMALGYGLGRFPRPHFPFHNSQEEYYYNHYMYKKYGTKSTDDNDYSRDYVFKPPQLSYDTYMESCMKRTDLPGMGRGGSGQEKPVTTTTTSTTTTTTPNSDSIRSNSTIENNSTSGTENPLTLTPKLVIPSEANPLPPAVGDTRPTGDDEDDDTVSIMEIGYPALIDQMKARRCVELYMVFSEKYMMQRSAESPLGGAQALDVAQQGVLTLVTSITLMLLNSNLLHLH